MGLDNYASRTPDDISLTEMDERAFEAAGLELCGGILSGDWGSSFRGKVYWDVVFEVTEVSLNDEWIPPETVAEMARALLDHTPAELARINDDVRPFRRGETSAAEMASLQCFFAICAGRGLGIIGWS